MATAASSRFAPAPPVLVEDLTVFSSLPAAHMDEFCRVAIAQLKPDMQDQPSSKLFARAAKQLGVQAQAVEVGVRALGHLLVRAAASNAPADRIIDGIELDIDPESLEALQRAYTDALPMLRPLIPEYHSLEWRLQVCTAGRHVRAGEMAPNFLLRLNTRAPAAASPHASHLLQADFANLRHVASELEAALAEERTTHARRLARRFTPASI